MSHTDHGSPDHGSPDHGHVDHGGSAWDGELSTKAIVYTVVGLAAVTILAFLGMAGMLYFMEGAEKADDPPPSPIAEANQRWQPPGPRLQEYPPTRDIEALHAHEAELLEGYAWVDESGGVVRIPVDEAMEVLVRRGFPAAGEVDALTAEIFGGSGPDASGPDAGAQEPGAQEETGGLE